MSTRDVLTVLLALGLASAALAQDASQPSFRDQYGVIAERNIFLKDRRPAAVARAATVEQPPPPPAPPVETKYVLIGLVEDSDTYRAHIEDRQNDRLLTLAEGDAVAEGTIVEIDLESVVYEKGGTRVRVAIGHDFRGETATFAPAPAAPAASPAATPTPSAAGAPAAAGSTDGLSLEERMRRRRAQETNP